jgi:hypothetical protein
MFDVAHRDNRFEPKEWVLGIAIGDARKAYPFSVLDRAVASGKGEISDSIGGQHVVIRYDARIARHRRSTASAGRCPASWPSGLPGVLNPKTEVFGAP